MGSERGSAGVMALGWMLALIVLSGVLVELSAQLITATRLSTATDRAALAAADTLVGVGGELPCSIAREVLAAHQFPMASCEVLETSVRVVAHLERWGINHQARAHAGVVDSGQE
jgi:secretion/DNA translocation related TadE-like protein